MKLILHIGMPKAGSTALQATLTEGRTILLSQGVLYPRVNISLSNHNILSLLLRKGENMPRYFRFLYGERADLIREDFEASWAQIKRQIHKHHPHTLILSGENIFLGLKTGDPEDFRARLLELTDDIHVAVYIRQPSKQYLSNVLQRVKSSSRFDPPEAASLRQPLETCERLFGRRPKVALFDRESLLQGDITRDFLARFVPEAAPVMSEISSPVLNQSLSAESMAILQNHREADHPGMDDQLTVDSVRWQRLLREIELRFDLDRRPTLKPEVERHIDQTCVDLLWLQQQYGIRFPDIDYDAIQPSPENPFQGFSRIADICEVDPARQERLLTLVTQNMSPRRVKMDRLTNWILKYTSNRLLRWVRQGLHWYRRLAISGAQRFDF